MLSLSPRARNLHSAPWWPRGAPRTQVRGQRVGAALLDAIEALARQKGVKTLKLETGNVAGFEPAWRLYERGGFTRCGAFLDYPDSQYSAFYEKALI